MAFEWLQTKISSTDVQAEPFSPPPTIATPHSKEVLSLGMMVVGGCVVGGPVVVGASVVVGGFVVAPAVV